MKYTTGMQTLYRALSLIRENIVPMPAKETQHKVLQKR